MLIRLIHVNAQVSNTGFIDTTGGEHIGKLSITGYVDMYYGHFTGSTAGTGQLPYLYSSARNNEMNINLAYLDFRYTDENFRARFVPGFGSYMNSNYAAEQGSLRNIVEASAGVRISKKSNIWLDAGVIGSAYTNESPVSKDHLMYTRSLCAENAPYYQSGARLSIPLGKKVKAAIYGLNGWQQIRDQNQFKSLGTQVEWTINDRHLLNWDIYMGDERSFERPNDRMRWFTDLYWIGKLGRHWDVTSCAFAGMQQRRKPSGADSSGTVAGNPAFTHHLWWYANFIARYSFGKRLSLSGRVEWFNDPSQVMQISMNPANQGYNTGSGGLCLNFQAGKTALLRMEWRKFFSEGDLYLKAGGGYSQQVNWFTGSMTVWF